MRLLVSSLAKYALAISTGAGLLAGCSSNGGSSLSPSGATGMSRLGHIGRIVTVDGVPQTAEHPNLGVRVVSISPDKKKKKKHHPQNQMISNLNAGSVGVWEAPHKSDAQIGTVSGITAAQGECTNVLFGIGKKEYWVTSSTSAPGTIDEVKVGGNGKTDKIVNTLDMASGDIPVGCAYDPATKNLAVESFLNNQVAIYANATGTPTISNDPFVETFFCGYDAKSDLFCDGFQSTGSAFAELPKGSATWTTISGIFTPSGFPGGVQWDGKYITVNDQNTHSIRGYTCSSGSCTLEQTVSLSGAVDCDQTWIAKGYVICPDAGLSEGTLYKYPAGGSAYATLTGSFNLPLASSAAEQ